MTARNLEHLGNEVASAPLVLAVTRDPELGRAVGEWLRPSDHRVATATRGGDALEIAARLNPAIVVQDVVLADMDGLELIGGLRELPGLSELPAVGLASVPPPAGPPDTHPPFQELLIKPLDRDELLSVVRSLLAPEPDRRRGLRPHVVVADDNDAQRRLMVLRLQHAGYRVTPATDGVEALELVRRLGPDAVVSDVLMPRSDGFTLALALRRDDRFTKLPIILTSSAFVDSADEELAAAAGADVLIARSPDLHELLDELADRITAPARPVGAEENGVRDAHGSDDVQRRYSQRIAVHLDHQLRLNAQLRERLAVQSVELAVLAGFGAEIAQRTDPSEMLDEVLARCAEVTGCGCGAAYLIDDRGEPAMRGHVGFPDPRPLRDFFGDRDLLWQAIGVAGRRTARFPSDAFDSERSQRMLERAGVSVLVVAPLFDGHELLGVLVVGSTRADDVAGDDSFIAAMAGHVGGALSRAHALYALSRSQQLTVQRLTRAAEFRDKETANHTARVSRYCALLAKLSGLEQEHSELIAASSVMHDIGKLGIPDSILLKPGQLTVPERIHMQRHADYGHRILAGEPDPLLDLAALIAWTHHERWDGGGYPRRLRREEIPVEGRIVAICDVFDALTSDRVYRPAMSVEDALELMLEGRGRDFDPRLLDLFIEAMPHVLEIRARHPDADQEPAARPRPRSGRTDS